MGSSAIDALLFLERVPQPIWVEDETGRVIYSNQASLALIGYAKDEYWGKPGHEVTHYMHPDGSPYPASECPMGAPRLTGETLHADEDWFIRPDGTFYPISWWAAPIDLPSGRGVVASFTDITEQRQLERAARERDAAEIRADLSRATGRRIVDSVAAANRATARDLHDGAQQRLVTLLINLQLARRELGPGAPEAAERLDAAIADAKTAVDELRQLAAGIHPAILTTRGLVPAITALAKRSPIPVIVTADVRFRLDESLESNAYFVIAEAITNALKHARASRIDVHVELADTLRVSIIDDGIGGVPSTAAGEGSGLGLTGLADRVAAFDGDLVIESPIGAGTRVSAEFSITA
ncbi:MAG TPA: PAS domain-containing sensor histidine kinase [Microbacterium sp.]|jgi:PAS domain S-box-containing protein|nr:PAS domain-containing sensor histidine kinase [Microbacterium sp.]